MEALIWLHLTAPRDVARPWALELFEQCRRHQALPHAGGILDQDDRLMAAMDFAAGVKGLFDAGAQVVMEYAEYHTSLQVRAADIADYVNRQEQVAGEHTQP